MHITTNTTKTYTLTLSTEEAIWLRDYLQNRMVEKETETTAAHRSAMFIALKEATHPSGAYPRGHNTISTEIVREAPQ